MSMKKNMMVNMNIISNTNISNFLFFYIPFLVFYCVFEFELFELDLEAIVC